MADELKANMTIDAIHRGFDQIKIQRFDLPVQYGKAPKILKNTQYPSMGDNTGESS